MDGSTKEVDLIFEVYNNGKLLQTLGSCYQGSIGVANGRQQPRRVGTCYRHKIMGIGDL